MAEPTYDTRTPVKAHEGLAATMFDEVFSQADTILNVAAGMTDLEGDLEQRGIHASVTSVDPIYAEPEFQGRPGLVPGLAQELHFPDESFDVTVCQFGLQHIPDDEVPAVIEEMLRVTKPAMDDKDAGRGFVIINPVFKPRHLEPALRSPQLRPYLAAVWDHPLDRFSISDRRVVFPSLLLHKTVNDTPESLHDLAVAIGSSGALKRSHRTLGETASRLFLHGRGRL